MRLGDVIWRQTIELRSRNHVSDEDDLRLAAIFRWTLREMFSGVMNERANSGRHLGGGAGSCAIRPSRQARDAAERNNDLSA